LVCSKKVLEDERNRTTLKKYPSESKHPDVIQAKTAIEFAKQAAPNSDEKELLKKIEINPNDHQSRYDLAVIYFGKALHQDAVDQTLEIIKRERSWNEEAARKLMFKIFDGLGPTHEVTVKGRKRFSSVWLL